MTLIINNDDVAKVLKMDVVIGALEEAYLQLVSKEAI